MSDGPADGLNTDDLPAGELVRLIRVAVDAELTDVVSDRFWQAGVRAVTENDLGGGQVEVVSSVGNDQDDINRTIATFDAGWTWTVDEVDATPGDSWKDHAAPIWFRTDRVLVPAWIDRDTVEGIEHARTVTVVDPGSAFGLGDHPTTRSSASRLAATLETDPGVRSVLDVGCGTGSLSIVAAQMGVPTVRAVDVARAAATSTRANAALNGVGDVLDVDTTPVAQLRGEYDVVIANILAPVLVSIAPDLRRLTAPTGTLIISGVLERRHDHVLSALAPLRVSETIVDDGWITICLRH